MIPIPGIFTIRGQRADPNRQWYDMKERLLQRSGRSSFCGRNASLPETGGIAVSRDGGIVKAKGERRNCGSLRSDRIFI